MSNNLQITLLKCLFIYFLFIFILGACNVSIGDYMDYCDILNNLHIIVKFHFFLSATVFVLCVLSLNVYGLLSNVYLEINGNCDRFL